MWARAARCTVAPSLMQRAAETQEWVANISRQAAFTRGYSPLSAAILDCLGGWIAAGPGALKENKFIIIIIE